MKRLCPSSRDMESTHNMFENHQIDTFNDTSNAKKVIALEGILGTGKYALCNSLEKHFFDRIEVFKQESNEKMLQMFYQDPKRYGFCLQWGMLKSRIYQMRLAQCNKKYTQKEYPEMFIWERSMLGDYVFALWNHLLGNITKDEMDTYESEFGGSIKNIESLSFLKDVDLFILLNGDPSHCKLRNDNGIQETEKGIPESYYEGLDDIYFHVFINMMKHNISKVLIKGSQSLEDPKVKENFFTEIASNAVKVPCVYQHQKMDKVADSFFYEGESCIMAAYNEVVKDNDFTGPIKEVYIPYNIMEIHPEEKGVNKDISEAYQVTFYRNEFKRVVLWHLSKNHDVHLYEK